MAKTNDTDKKPYKVSWFSRILVVLFVCLGLIGLVMLPIGIVKYGRDNELQQSPVTTNGSIVNKRSICKVKTGCYYYLDYSFQPGQNLTETSTQLVGLKTWDSYHEGQSAEIIYDNAKPSINYLDGYQTTTNIDRVVIGLGILGIVISLIGLRYLSRHLRLE